jgi:integrase
MSNNDETLIKEWLDECRTESTRQAYTHYIKTFQAWYEKPLSLFLKLDIKEMRHTALKFQNEQVKKGIKTNTVIAMMTALGSFCNQNGRPLPLRGKRLRIQIDLDSHVFTNGDLASMFDVGNTQEKAILSAFTSLGWEVGAILGLKASFIDSLIKKAREDKAEFAYFHNQRQKTGALRLGVLNPLALEWLEKWLGEWHGENLFEYTTKEGINSMMRRLAREAQIKRTGRIHSHLIRKWVMSGLSRAGFNDFQIKYVMGKAIPLSDATYLQTLEQEIQERYPQAFQNYLNIKHSPAAVSSLAKAMTEKDHKIAELEQGIAELRDLIKTQTDKMRGLEERIEQQETN